ncbi:hypothetical protein [Nonomuraea sp. NPDC049750]|uniref:hypothetical protein n=1 Tax=Nonomuraea sp. NPDC049750 TaxID=3154738 RepID=UPI0033D5F0CF
MGDFGGDDYDRGATLQIWEVTTGRCVNVIDWIEGGIGWPGYGEVIQWSADESRLALAYRSSNVGVWDPFGGETEPIGTARLTYSGRPDPFALAPDGVRAYVLQEADARAHGAVVPLDGGAVWPDDRHLSAVLALLPELPMPFYGGISSNDRPWVAFTALRIVTTGVDVDPW